MPADTCTARLSLSVCSARKFCQMIQSVQWSSFRMSCFTFGGISTQKRTYEACKAPRGYDHGRVRGLRQCQCPSTSDARIVTSCGVARCWKAPSVASRRYLVGVTDAPRTRPRVTHVGSTSSHRVSSKSACQFPPTALCSAAIPAPF